MLRSARERGYGAGGGEAKSEGETGPRSFPLTEEEGQAIGDEVDCVKAYGHAEKGKFVIDRIEPESGKENEDASMGDKRPPLTFS
jgi:hypothetical protein